MDSYSEMTEALQVESMASLADLPESENKRPVRVAGMVTSVTVKNTRKNEKMMFLRLEDRYADMEILVFPRQCEKLAHLLHTDAVLYVEGNLSVREDEPVKILLSDARALRENGTVGDLHKEERVPVAEKKEPVSDVSEDKPTSVVSHATQSASSPTRVTARQIQKLYLRVPDLSGDRYQKAKNLVEIFEGPVRVIFYDTASASYVPFEQGIDASPFVVGELIGLLGRDNVVPK